MPDDGSYDEDEFRSFMSHWPTGVTVVTSRDGGGAPAGCTVNAMMSVSLFPPRLMVSLATTSATLKAILRAGDFGLNVLGADQEELCHLFAKGPKGDRFSRVRYDYRHGVPLLADVTAAIVCTVQDTMNCGDHVLIVGAPVWHTVRGDDSPLVFHRRRYRRLAHAND